MKEVKLSDVHNIPEEQKDHDNAQNLFYHLKQKHQAEEGHKSW